MSNATSSRTTRPPKQANVAFSVADISALAKSLRAAFAGVDAAPTQVQMLNLLAKAAGHQNYQRLRAQASAIPVALASGGAAEAAAATAAKAKTTAIRVPASEGEVVLTPHASKALTQFDSDGKLTRWPHKFAVQRVAMWGFVDSL